jgi:hypothetical protein
VASRFWLTRRYLPGFVDLIPERLRGPGQWHQDLRSILGDIELRVVPVAHDCFDGFYQAYWRRPEAYLQAEVRDTISVFHRIPKRDVDWGLDRLREDLVSGRWRRRHVDLLQRDELDVGLRIVVAEVAGLRRVQTAD